MHENGISKMHLMALLTDTEDAKMQIDINSFVSDIVNLNDQIGLT